MPSRGRITLRQWVDAALGSQLLGVWTLLISFALSFFARITPIPGDPVLSIPENMLLNLLSALAAFGFLQIVTRPLLHWLPTWRSIHVATVFFAGSVRGLTLYASMGLVGGHSTNSVLFRVTSSGVLYGFTLLISSFAVGAMESRVRILRELRRTSHVLEQEVANNKQRIDGWYQSLALNLKARLRREVDVHLGSDKSAVANGLKEHVAEVIRPLSNELMNQVPELEPPVVPVERRLALQILISTLDIEWRVYPLLISSLGSAVSLAAYVQFSKPNQILPFVAAGLTNWLGYSVGNRVYRRIQQGRTWPYRATYFLVIFTVFNLPSSIIALGTFGQPGGLPAIWASALVLSFALSAAGLIISISVAVERAIVLDARKLEDLNRDLKWVAARTSALMWERQRDLSRILHGPVQSALAAAAIRIDMASDNPQEMATIVEESRASIIAAINEITDGEGGKLDIAKGFERVVEGWDGVSQVVVGIDAALEKRINEDQSCARIVFDIVQEAVANSARHGEAENVVVSVTDAGLNRVAIEVRDDGNGIKPDLIPGLGTRLLDDCTLEWSRQGLERGVLLRCLVPILENPDFSRIGPATLNLTGY